jgi:hypothetical protein
MPFEKKYNNLGNTTRMYVPEVCREYFETILDKLDSLCEEEREDIKNSVNNFNKKKFNGISQKGHRGFIKRYKVLGDTTQVRIPIVIKDKIRELVYELEEVAQSNDLNKVNEVLDGVSEIVKWYK